MTHQQYDWLAEHRRKRRETQVVAHFEIDL